MNQYKIQILLLGILLCLNIQSNAQKKTQLTWARNTHKALEGRYVWRSKPIIYKDKLYMKYKYKQKGILRDLIALVSYDGKNWLSSIFTNKEGKLPSTLSTLTESDDFIIYKDRLFFEAVSVNAKTRYNMYDKSAIRSMYYFDGAKIHAIKNPEGYTIDGIEAVHNGKLYIRYKKSINSYYKFYLFAYDGQKLSFIAKKPTLQFYKPLSLNGKLHFIESDRDNVLSKAGNKIWTLNSNAFDFSKTQDLTDIQPIIWNGSIYCVSDYISNSKPKIFATNVEKTVNVYELAPEHTFNRDVPMTVIDGKLYTGQTKSLEGRYYRNLVIMDGKSRAKPYQIKLSNKFPGEYIADNAFEYMGSPIKYKNSLFIKVGKKRYGKEKDGLLVQGTFNKNGKPTFTWIEDSYIYIGEKATPVKVHYKGNPIVFKDELYLCYRRDDKKGSFLIKYTP